MSCDLFFVLEKPFKVNKTKIKWMVFVWSLSSIKHKVEVKTQHPLFIKYWKGIGKSK